MRGSRSLVWMGCLLLGAASCGGKPTCPGGDLACLFASLTVSDFQTSGSVGPKLTLSPVTTAALSSAQIRNQTRANADGGFYMSGPGQVTYSSPSDSAGMAFLWRDPLHCRPAFCFTPCPKGVRCLGSSFCTPSVKDGQLSGVTLEQVEYAKAPEQDIDFTLDVTPVSAVGCPADVTALLAAGSTDVYVGGTAINDIFIPGTKSSGGGSPDGGNGGDSGDWYYHWNCNGDAQCLATNPGGTPTGVNDEGPSYSACAALLTFAQRNWGSAATDACDHSST